MRHHAFGRTPFIVTDVGFGAWQIGGAWGDVSEADGRAALNAALDAGMTFMTRLTSMATAARKKSSPMC